MMDAVSKISAFENGMMDYDESVEFFQELVDTGLIWSLQGSYQRTMFDLLRAGEICLPEHVDDIVATTSP